MPTQDLDDHTKTRLGCSSMIITEKSFEVQTSDWPRCFLFFSRRGILYRCLLTKASSAALNFWDRSLGGITAESQW